MHEILKAFQKLARLLAQFLKNLLYSLENYLRGKLKEIPNPIPRRRIVVIEGIMAREELKRELQQFAEEQGFSHLEVEQRVRSYLWEIAADNNYLTIPFWDVALSWVFGTIYEGLVFDEKKLEELRPFIGKKPIVFVPNHRSHIDYMLLSYLFYQNRVPLPLVCAGSNLSFWPLGPLFRKGGAFFIRRSYEGNHLYARAVQLYIEELLRDKAVIEFFIEGTRSRTGKLLSPRMGIVSTLVESYFRGATDDVLLVPTSVTYESVLEEKSYLAEQSGGLKRNESPVDLVQIPRHLNKRYGKVYIRFGEVLSLKDYLKNAKREQKREKVEEIAYDLTYGINKSSVVTPGSLVAAALLTHPKRVMTPEALTARLEPLIDYLRYKGNHLSEPLYRYRGASIHEATREMAGRGLIQEISDEEGTCYVIPEEKRASLSFNKNGSLHFFVSMAVLGTLIQRSSGRLSYAQLESQYRTFQKILRYEFTFSRRQSLRDHLIRLLSYLETKRVLRFVDETILLEPDGSTALHSFTSLIQNYLEGYWVVWKSLPSLGSRRWEKQELIKWLLHKGNIFYLKERIRHREAVSRFLFQNALTSFRDLGLLQEETAGWGRRQKTFYRKMTEFPPEITKELESWNRQRADSA